MNSSITSARWALAKAAAVLVLGLAAAATSAITGESSPGNLQAAGIPFDGTLTVADFNYMANPSPARTPAPGSPQPLS